LGELTTMNKIAFLFPGQGAQSAGMGRSLYEASPAAREVFATVDAACGFSVSDLCFNGSDDELRQTNVTQPALFAVSVAAFAALREAGIKPSATAGHSVGEYAALVAAGSLTVHDGARLVKARSEAMADCATKRPGAMAAVLGPTYDVILEVCKSVVNYGVVVPANINAPGQIVISGETNAVEAASALLKERGAKRVVPLAVSGAFHSPLMEMAGTILTGVLNLTHVSPPQISFIANVVADYVTTPEQVRAHLAHQVSGPVRWVETVTRLAGDGYTTFIECGPGNVLAGLNKRIVPDVKTLNVSDADNLGQTVQALQAKSGGVA
jgi:[acyl-carrier-protein] S-malonyltransferase